MGKISFKTKEEWLNFRKGKITGTIASAVIGKNPYMSNTEAWEIITLKKEPKDISDKSYVIKGKSAEEYIAKLFELDHPEYIVEDNPNNEYIVVYDDNHPFIMDTPDRFLIEKETNRKGVLEIKTTEIFSSFQKEKWSNNNIPSNYYVQLLQEMYCDEADFGILVVELKHNEDITSRKTYIVQRQDVQEDIEYLIENEIKFYEVNVVGNKRPALVI